jgi:hypothetical protein
MATIPEAIAIAVQYHRAGRLRDAEQVYRQVLAIGTSGHAAAHALCFCSALATRRPLPLAASTANRVVCCPRRVLTCRNSNRLKLRNLEAALAKKETPKNGHNRLEEAIALLIQNEAAFVGRLAESDKRASEFERVTSERFARIEKDMAAILRILAEHSQILERLPEAVRDKIGFKG